MNLHSGGIDHPSERQPNGNRQSGRGNIGNWREGARWYGVVLLLLAGTCAGPACAGAAAVPEGTVPELRFAELFHRPIGPAGLEPDARLLALAGQTVQMAGYVIRMPGRPAHVFLLAPYPGELPDDDDALADDLPANLVFVHLADAAVLPPGVAWLQVRGRLSVGPQDEPDRHVSHVRLELDTAGTGLLLRQLGAAVPTAVVPATR